MGSILPYSTYADGGGVDFANAIAQFSSVFGSIWSFIMDNWVFAIFIIIPVVGAILAWVISFFNGRK